jgi:acetyl esterase/lipase
MVREAWLRQALAAYACPPDAPEHRPLEADLSGLPPLLVQAGTDEILLGDALRLAARARACGVRCWMEIYHRRWHVFQLQATQLQGARAAIDAVAEYARQRVAGADRGVREAARSAERVENSAPVSA